MLIKYLLVHIVERGPQQVAEPGDHAVGQLHILMDQRRNGVERVEQEMRMQLHLQDLQLCLGQFRLQLRRDQFALHVRAILGFPVFTPQIRTPGASSVILAPDAGVAPQYHVESAMTEVGLQIRLFGKPDCKINRRMGVVLVSDSDPLKAMERAKATASKIKFVFK